MAPRNSVEAEILIVLRELRDRMAQIDLHRIQSDEKIISAIQTLSSSMDRERAERRQLEFEEASARVLIRKKMVDDTLVVGDTAEKIKKEVDRQMNKNKIDYGTIWRNNIIPAILTTLTIAVVLAALTTAVPWISDVLFKAFGVK